MIVPRTVIGARFMKAGRMYFFNSGGVDDVSLGEMVIVRTDLGEDAARVAILPTDSPLVMVDPPLGTVVRRATVAIRRTAGTKRPRDTGLGASSSGCQAWGSGCASSSPSPRPCARSYRVVYGVSHSGP